MSHDEYKRLWSVILAVIVAAFVISLAAEIGAPQPVEAAVRVAAKRFGLLP